MNKTKTGATPTNVGFAKTDGIIRKLSKKEEAQQKRNLKQISKIRF